MSRIVLYWRVPGTSSPSGSSKPGKGSRSAGVARISAGNSRAAAATAAAFGAEALIILSNVPGLLADFPDEQPTAAFAEQAAEKLEELALKGCIFRIRDGEKRSYQAYQFVVGVYEFQLNSLDREFAELSSIAEEAGEPSATAMIRMERVTAPNYKSPTEEHNFEQTTVRREGRDRRFPAVLPGWRSRTCRS